MKKISMILTIALAVLMFAGCEEQKTENGNQTKKLDEQYNTEEQVEQALLDVNEKNAKQASVFSGVKSISHVIGLSFEGIPKEKNLDKILSILKKYRIKATFFVQGIKTSEDPTLVKKISDAGHEVGNYTLNAEKKMEKKSADELVTDFVKTNVILKDITGKEISYIRCNATKYTETVRKAVLASGLKGAVAPANFLSWQSLLKQSEADGYVKGLKNGSILSIKLDSVLDSTEFKKEKEEEKPADDKKAGIKSEKKVGSEDKRLVSVVRIVCKAANKNKIKLCGVSSLKGYNDKDMSKTFTAERRKNGGRKAPVINTVNTSKAYIGLTFRNIGDGDIVNRVLAALKSKNMKATFFVTAEDIIESPTVVKSIVSAGHEIGNGGLSKDSMVGKSFKTICQGIYKTKKLLKSKYGVQAKYFMTADAKYDNTIREAASAFGLKIAGYNKSPIRTVSQSVSAVSTYLKNGFQTGDIVAFRLDNYSRVDEAVKIVASKAAVSSYSVLGIQSLFAKSEAKKSLTSIPGWNKVKKNKNWSKIQVNESRVIQKVNTNQKVVFFTFDDWGSDNTIRNLLSVLKKYGIKGTFFVRGNGVDMNPNLLKAISDAGHGIGNHTYNHKVITKISKATLQSEIVKCHQSIVKAIGKCPTLYFRPPTMEIDNATRKAIFATGEKYILLGDTLSTHDYENTPNEVAKLVMDNLEPGGVITMHMSDNACAAKAVPVLVKKLKEKGYKIGDLRNYLK